MVIYVSLFLPDSYYKDIYSIDYKKLKKQGIKYLLFDFDNTIIEMNKYRYTKKHDELFKELKKDFNIAIISNTINKQKIEDFTKKCGIEYILLAMKPLKRGFKKIIKKNNLKSEEICMIGDQLVTDIYGAKKMHIKAILVDRINNEELPLTRLNRKLEKRILKKLNRDHNFKKGVYYD